MFIAYCHFDCIFAASLCRVSAELEGCCLMNLQKVERFSVSNLNRSLRHVLKSMICAITITPIVVQDAAFTSVVWKLEASRAQTLTVDIFRDVEDIFLN